ncbi:MAG: long-chain fatty acid--CoA ligase [Haliscomenobacter sp.]|uniref:AMP-dependent synthetase/ligase n=1 Tax=Haliscomenobacter sp. TaxID=2717303 RepID=UPI0029A63E5E|nr:long-chain fatty acid--CoA ligase [Haliscomenobacter sp.]MDX2068343.1 long-chain fatty acid--CoA ligase [Haliscomenobacter sp.]
MEPTRLSDLIHYQAANFPLQRAFGHRVDGEWKYYSTQEVIELGNKVSRGLLKLGVKKGDRIGVAVTQNRPEWTILDVGIQQIGAINVPVYATITTEDYAYIFNDSEAKYCFVGGGDLYEKVKAAQAQVPSLKEIYSFDKKEGQPYWETIFAEDGQAEVDALQAQIKPEELATIIYTSGTTGVPKGVMLSHNNIISNIMAGKGAFPFVAGDTVLSFLPVCHIYERVVIYLYTLFGVSVAFTGTDNLGGEQGDLMAVKPHFFTTVPRLLEKVYERIYNKGLDLTGLKKKLFFWALKLTEDYHYEFKPKGWKAIQWKIADKLIFSKWRAALGGNLKGITTGAAACPRRIAQVFSAAGIPIREGYGLTETSPVITLNLFEPGGALLGSVGPVIDQVEVLIDESDGIFRPGEGEILAYGPNVMMGYYNKPEATAAVMKTINGKTWFCTGDVGKMVDGPGGRKYLQITDRKKELLKTSGGKYVAPTPIESRFRENFLIEQMMVIGEQRKFVSALIVPAEPALKDWCDENQVEWTTFPEMLHHPKVLGKFQSIVDDINPSFSHIDQIKKFRLLDKVWEPVKSDGTEAELTPTMKLKRRVILEKYKAEIEDIYAE